jgi:8-oxo-dGTP pyrophosphatase MutT (NUDIX family)
MSSERRRERPPIRELSYGGVVVRQDPAHGRREVVAIVPRGKRALALPKGGAETDEAPEYSAAREVREETGVTARVRSELGDVTYWYRRGGRRVHKTVRFYLFDYVDGSTDDHDHEVDEARWIPLEEARTALTYPGERDMIERAVQQLADGAPDR